MTGKKFLILSLFLGAFITNAFCQEFLDKDKRFMKLTEVSTDKAYGYEIKKPIKVGETETAIGAYLNALKLTNGDVLHIADMKFDYKGKNGVTMVVLRFEQSKETETIYFLTKEFEQPKALIGYGFKTTEDLPKVEIFPADSVVNVSACSSTIYAVDDLLLKEKVGELQAPDKNPEFSGGLEELKKYFVANPLKDEKASQLIFRVSIAFLVTCDGKSGNYVIVSKGKGQLATYANQVLAIVNKMSQNWRPALKDGKPVDAYQILSFTVAGGQLDKVSFR